MDACGAENHTSSRPRQRGVRVAKVPFTSGRQRPAGRTGTPGPPPPRAAPPHVPGVARPVGRALGGAMGRSEGQRDGAALVAAGHARPLLAARRTALRPSPPAGGVTVREAAGSPHPERDVLRFRRSLQSSAVTPPSKTSVILFDSHWHSQQRVLPPANLRRVRRRGDPSPARVLWGAP